MCCSVLSLGIIPPLGHLLSLSISICLSPQSVYLSFYSFFSLSCFPFFLPLLSFSNSLPIFLFLYLPFFILHFSSFLFLLLLYHLFLPLFPFSLFLFPVLFLSCLLSSLSLLSFLLLFLCLSLPCLFPPFLPLPLSPPHSLFASSYYPHQGESKPIVLCLANSIYNSWFSDIKRINIPYCGPSDPL